MTATMNDAWFVAAMVKATTDMWEKGWDERNGGNVSLRLTDADVAPYLAGIGETRRLPMTEAIPEIAGQSYIVTGTGKFFRNVQIDPAANLGVIRVTADGAAVEVLWGYSDGGGPTSELPAHFKSHLARQKATAGRDRVIMHCHATNLIALTYVLAWTDANVTRALWEGSTECLVVFPEGVATIPWLVPGTDVIGDATAEALGRRPLTLWPFHGVFGAGPTLDDAFGLIDTAEKSAEILVKVISMGGPFQSMATQNLIDLAARFRVVPQAEAMARDGWHLAPKVVRA
ncbi:rhamnulose-1-phosphate aldolase [Siculibacillus lacustris]|uniref:Rhamnulose-1-phosphate aldolase n=1 Tax=Siculibacillus lacustris TaxID=1549641 RepID=A0A4Q9W076_9HYPH|nr:rhamnulose-1-phosphate aldolase [Siculibacillus lacustris]TBW41383.1 rhamnulose-1-phosphate aldolase [Siculibacillus lacustris]